MMVCLRNVLVWKYQSLQFGKVFLLFSRCVIHRMYISINMLLLVLLFLNVLYSLAPTSFKENLIKTDSVYMFSMVTTSVN